MLKVGYDAQAFLSANGGTGKGAQLRNLVGPFLDTFVGFASTDPNRSGLPLVQEGRQSYTLWHQFSLPRSLRKHSIEVFLAPYNVAPLFLPRHMRLVLVLHDTILQKGFRRPDRKGRLLDLYRRWQIPHSVARAQVVLTVSEHARGEILDAFPAADVRVLPCTLPVEWFSLRPLERRLGYVLMVSSSAPHKNFMGGLEGYALYARGAGRAARPLKVVGLSSEAVTYQKDLERLGIKHLVMFLPFLSEEELISVYQDAGALLFPSFAEGFGIPMLEAMATGTPAIAARRTSLPEVGGDAAEYFDPGDPDDIAQALRKVLFDGETSRRMAQRGIKRAQTFHPDVVRSKVVALWQEVAGVSAPGSAWPLAAQTSHPELQP